VVTWGLLEDYDRDIRLLVFATHWQTDEQKRAIHASITTELVQKISARFGKNIPIIVTADFNERASAPNFQQMLSELELTNCVKQANSVDQIAVRGAIPTDSGMDTDDITRYSSDHKPIWCDVEL
jgi:endonuclease/exonuclease/phosphatase family metal-dependent hydrolase